MNLCVRWFRRYLSSCPAIPIGLSSTLQTGSSTNPYIDLRWLSPHLIAGFITPPVHRCPNETGLAFNDGHLARCNRTGESRPHDLSIPNAALSYLSYSPWMTFRVVLISTDRLRNVLTSHVAVSSGDFYQTPYTFS